MVCRTRTRNSDTRALCVAQLSSCTHTKCVSSSRFYLSPNQIKCVTRRHRVRAIATSSVQAKVRRFLWFPIRLNRHLNESYSRGTRARARKRFQYDASKATHVLFRFFSSLSLCPLCMHSKMKRPILFWSWRVSRHRRRLLTALCELCVRCDGFNYWWIGENRNRFALPAVVSF